MAGAAGGVVFQHHGHGAGSGPGGRDALRHRRAADARGRSGPARVVRVAGGDAQGRTLAAALRRAFRAGVAGVSGAVLQGRVGRRSCRGNGRGPRLFAHRGRGARRVRAQGTPARDLVSRHRRRHRRAGSAQRRGSGGDRPRSRAPAAGGGVFLRLLFRVQQAAGAGQSAGNGHDGPVPAQRGVHAPGVLAVPDGVAGLARRRARGPASGGGDHRRGVLPHAQRAEDHPRGHGLHARAGGAVGRGLPRHLFSARTGFRDRTRGDRPDLRQRGPAGAGPAARGDRPGPRALS